MPCHLHLIPTMTTTTTMRLVCSATLSMTALFGVSCEMFQRPNAGGAAGAGAGQDPYYGYGQSSGDYAQVTPVDQGGGAGYGGAGGYTGGSDPYYGYGDTGSSGFPAGGEGAAPAPSPPSGTYGGGGGGSSYTVQPGDTLFGISRRHGTSVSALKSANGLNSDLIRAGQVLRIP